MIGFRLAKRGKIKTLIVLLILSSLLFGVGMMLLFNV